MNNIDEKDEIVTYVPKLAELSEFLIFADELTPFADKIKDLPYGILSLMACALYDIKSGIEEDIDPPDWPIYEKIYYFIAGILLTKGEKVLGFDNDDIKKLDNIVELLVTKLSLLEGHYAGILDAKFIDGVWMYGMTEEQATKFLSEIEHNAEKKR